jgi:hypothetical protein
LKKYRFQGIASPTYLTGTLVHASGEVLGEAEMTEQLESRDVGWLETDRFAVPVQHAPPNQYESIADLYGERAALSVRAEDDRGRASDYQVEVVLVEAP